MTPTSPASPDPERGRAVADFARSVQNWRRLASNGLLASPKEKIGMRLPFKDGTSPFVFRETARLAAVTDNPAVIVIEFRLAFLGSNPQLHAAFRRECVLHTPLFAGFPGFRSKLWADDVQTGVYAGLYEWEGRDAASHYAERMVALLAPFSNRGTARHQVIGGLRRDAFLSSRSGGEAVDPSDWWRLLNG